MVPNRGSNLAGRKAFHPEGKEPRAGGCTGDGRTSKVTDNTLQASNGVRFGLRPVTRRQSQRHERMDLGNWAHGEQPEPGGG
jgi:hypothetical protein